MKTKTTIESGSCWVRRSDHMMVQVLENDGTTVTWSVICGGLDTPGEEGTTPESQLRTLFFPVTEEEATMREEYEVQERSVREVALRYRISSYTAYYRLKRVGTEFRPGGVRPGKEYPRSRVLLENLQVTYDRLEESMRQGQGGRGIARDVADELELSESRAYQLRRIVLTVLDHIERDADLPTILDASGLENQEEVLRKFVAYVRARKQGSLHA